MIAGGAVFVSSAGGRPGAAGAGGVIACLPRWTKEVQEVDLLTSFAAVADWKGGGKGERKKG